MKNRDPIPVLIWFCLMAGIVAVAFARSGRKVNLWSGHPLDVDLLFIGLYFMRMLAELPISTKDLHREEKKSADAATWSAAAAFCVEAEAAHGSHHRPFDDRFL